jgi:hypothetical protein
MNTVSRIKIRKLTIIFSILFSAFLFSASAIYAQGTTSIRDVTNRYYAKVGSDGALLVAEGASADVTAANSTCFLSSAASTNATVCKATPGVVNTIHITNTTSTKYYLRLYNLATTPICSSATGYVETIPAIEDGVNGRASSVQAFSAGIGFCLTGGGGSTDNTSAATGVYITILYK